MDTPSFSRFETLRALSVAAIVTNVGIVLTGGIVRLTGSGLGCADWPTCTGDRVLPSADADAGWHQYIEFGNRLLTFVVLAVAIAVWVAARREAPHRADIRRAALGLPLGVVAQAVLGGITVLTDLNPLIVAAHLLLSMGLIAIATVLHHLVTSPAAREPDAGRRPDRALLVAKVLVVLGFGVLVLGTLVTASGPHAGDPGTPRLAFDIRVVARAHSAAVWVTVLTTVGLIVAAKRSLVGREVGRAAQVLLAVEVVQGGVGYTQYALGVPPGLVALHLVLASIFWIAALRVWLAAREVARGADDARPPSALASA